MPPEYPEQERVSREDPVEIRDENGDVVRIEWAVYPDGLRVGLGEITAGPSQGHRFLRFEGGQPTLEQLQRLAIGPFELRVSDFSVHHGTVILEQGQNEAKDEAGENFIRATAIVNEQILPYHAEEDLRLLPRRAIQTDEQERILERVWRSGQNIIAEKNTYLDDLGVQITTGLHLDGPDRGKLYETRRVMGLQAGTAIPKMTIHTPHGDIGQLRLTAVTRDIRRADTAEPLSEPDQRRVWIELQGESSVEVEKG